jgi:hypothetical protein
MNSFDGFSLSGANTTRYVPILGDAAGMIGAYRRTLGGKTRAKKYRENKVELGKVTLFLLDGELRTKTLDKAVKTLGLRAYVVLYRPFDVKLKKRLETLCKKCLSQGLIKKDGSIADWIRQDIERLETEQDEFIRDNLAAPIQSYIDYLKAREEYESAIDNPPVDSASCKEIVTIQ